MPGFRLSLHRKILYAFLALSIIPTAFLAITSSRRMLDVEAELRKSATVALDTQAAQGLELRAKMVAAELEGFLSGCVQDLLSLSLLPPEQETWERFGDVHRREVWERRLVAGVPAEVRESIPLYAELSFVAPDGRELLHLEGGRATGELRDLSRPQEARYPGEDYFARAASLPEGTVYMAPLVGRHLSREQQLAGAATPEEAVGGQTYAGVLRLATALRDQGGALTGVVVLSLDHRHLMSFTQHILPTEEQFTVFPSYDSGNYAFMFDAEGWILTHPKYWDIRGLDEQGSLVPPLREDSTEEELRRGPPFNLLHAGFIHANYPLVAKAVLEGRSGVADVTNVGGSEKIMAYAPVRYPGPVAASAGETFGGITIGAEVAQFHRGALETSEAIRRQITRSVSEYWMLISVIAVLVIFSAYMLSQGIIEPVLKLTLGTREMARGKRPPPIEVDSGDEVEELAHSFNGMARELEHRRNRLTNTLEALRRSRQSLMRERNFKDAVLENVESGILTLDAANRVTSINSPALEILRLEAGDDRPQLARNLEEGLASDRPTRWSRYVEMEAAGRMLTFRLCLLPLPGGAGAGRLLVVEDLTERAQMRSRMARMERLASLGRLSAGLAHEIRNPLTGVCLLLDELHDRLLQDPADQELIRKALSEIERLERLVSELLNFSSQSKVQFEEGRIEQVLADVLFLPRKRCEAAGIGFELRVEEALPAIRFDAAKLKQALHNLINNALEVMGPGGSLAVLLEPAQGGIFLRIRDTGPGIPPERQALIFEPFYTTKGEGTGLGLAITHNIVSEHGGRIEVQSVPGEGACFSLWFPAAPAQG